MKILHVSESITGGPASYLNELISHQVDNFEKIALLVPDSQKNHIGKIEGVFVNTFRRKARGISALFDLAKEYVRILKNEHFDIVHIHSTFAGVICRLVTPVFFVKNKPKILYCAHCWYFDRPATSFLTKFSIFVEKILYEVTDAVVNISPHEKTLLASHGFSPDKQFDIVSGVTDISANDLNKSIQINYEFPIKLLFVGRLDNQKGVDYLVKSLARIDFKKYHVTVVGSSVVDGAKYCFPEEVVRHDWVSREAVKDLMINSHFLLMPSRWEGMPLTVIESLRCGRPVIGNDIPSLDAIFNMASNDSSLPGCLIDYENPLALSEYLNEISAADWETMRGAARQFYLENFRPNSMLKLIDSVYIKLSSKQ